jgi:hypothetical protein
MVLLRSFAAATAFSLLAVTASAETAAPVRQELVINTGSGPKSFQVELANSRTSRANGQPG